MIIFNKYKVTNMKKFKKFMFVSILSVSMFIFTFTATLNAYSKDIPQFDFISVQEGDTLWSIASSYSGNVEIRELIYNITKENNIQNSSIYPGDIIRIPLN